MAGALWTVATAALAAVLGGVGLWRPWLVLPVLLALAYGCLRATRGLPRIRLDRSSLVALVSVAALAGLWYGMTHAEQVLPRRDAGSNLQAAISLAGSGVRVVPVDLGSIGGPASLDVPGITLASPAFYQVGSTSAPRVQPQFPVGPAGLVSLGVWAGAPLSSLTPAFVVPGLAMALAVLTIGLLAAAILGARAGPVVALAVAVVFPVVHTARSTYSEPFATLTLSAALLCLTLAARDRSGRAAVLAGLLFGGTTLVRIDALREVVLVVLAAALYAARGHRWCAHLLLALGGSTAFGMAAAMVLSPRYLADIAGSLVPLAVAGVLACGMAGALTLLARRRPLVGPPWLPAATAVAVVVMGLVLASRPLWQVVRQSPDDPGARVVAGLQLRQGLPVDGGRTYAERTLEWVSWWVGPIAPAVALLVLAAATALAVRAWQSHRMPAWAGAALVVSGSSLLTLWRPGITPDHPWAERRLVLAVCLIVVLVVAAARWCLHRPWPLPLRRTTAILVLAAVFVPTLVATRPHAQGRVEAGSPAAVEQACAGFVDGDVALMVDARAANEWPQVLRGQCGVPALSTTTALRTDAEALAAAIAEVEAAVAASGGRLVLVAGEGPQSLIDITGEAPRRLVDVTVSEDARLLLTRPDALVPLRIALWSSTVRP